MNSFNLNTPPSGTPTSASVTPRQAARPTTATLTQQQQTQIMSDLIYQAERFSPLSYQHSRTEGRTFRPDGKVSQQELQSASAVTQSLIQDLQQKRDFLQGAINQGHLEANAVAKSNLPYLSNRDTGRAVFPFEGAANIPPQNREWELIHSGASLRAEAGTLNTAAQTLSDAILNADATLTDRIEFQDANNDGTISNAEVIASIDARITQEQSKRTLYQHLDQNFDRLSAYQNDTESTWFGRSGEYLSTGDMQRAITAPQNRNYAASLVPSLLIAGNLQQQPSGIPGSQGTLAGRD